MALLTLVCRVRDDVRIALPVAASRAAERIAADGGADVVWTKLSGADLMDAAAAEKVTFAGSQDGGFIFPDFLPAFDATAAFVNVLELLAKAEVELSEVVAELPKVHTAHETVITPFEEKGVLMRKLVERLKDHDVLLVDGVKVNRDSEWALMLPDPEEPVTHVWAEGESPARAGDLVREHAAIVQEILGE
jgi:mannose-1-phosphate guanylyltransferase/phosphomannomutase